MDRVHANAHELEQFAHRLRSNSDEVVRLAQQLDRTLQTIDWNDSVKDRIDRDVSEATAGLKKLSQTLQAHAHEVDRKSHQLRDFLGR
ncbi:hypothetical protein [Brevibacterium album]|uniref:hypothetical protein n=1 Tax=Brevibacterium album TaxID=417948 RepID=UPI0003FF3D59|nr:hypothetical protein [Brevibacterium album]